MLGATADRVAALQARCLRGRGHQPSRVVLETHPLAGRRRIRMVELHQQRLVLMPSYFATRRLLDDCFKAAGAEPLVPATLSDLKMIPIENPTPIRTPGILWRLDGEKAAPVQSFAVSVRKTSLGNSLRKAGPG